MEGGGFHLGSSGLFKNVFDIVADRIQLVLDKRNLTKVENGPSAQMEKEWHGHARKKVIDQYAGDGGQGRGDNRILIEASKTMETNDLKMGNHRSQNE